MIEGEYRKHLYALILAGGGGTRLWPKSRNNFPKQFIKLFKGQTLTQITCERLKKILPWEKIYCTTVSESYKKEILKEVPEFIEKNIIVEPERRDTAPAHGIGAAFIFKNDPQAVIINESADRLVKPINKYLKTLLAAAKVAYEDKIFVSMGVKPRYPHVGLGHIKKGVIYRSVEGIKLYKADRFVEKPKLNLAKRFTASGQYYWNAGQFVWRAGDYLEALGKFESKVGESLRNIISVIGTKEEKEIILKEYKKIPTKTVDGKPLSVDFAVIEKIKGMLVVEGNFFWTDIGDWKEVWNNLPQDEMGNVIIDGEVPGGEIINIDTSDALIHTDGRLIAVVDVDNVVIVDTKEILLVCSKSKAQNVKKVVEMLKMQGRKELL
ncbi:hypothetical protein A2Z67_00865 [Candidatus Woesebacteria bacterium RBG_13_36_22]|uniref:Nucleotidyl transferase domain-containing protein n=1 Tax=Candidatus Woesebacteria bacterium RBG_13_36_22 TaxID=1802478 RepID=A0A1F7X5X0_9BACT|nr:MAG: hypothetical protein A2Z67_00865 [Candidatus Woesebacteria bacterium RBG_13_36_22]